MNIAMVYRQAVVGLQQCSDTAELDADVLLACVLQVNRAYLKAHAEQMLTAEQIQTFQTYVRRRQQGEPVAYILGQQDFWTERFVVTPDVLIPRPETELLVECALQKYQQQESLQILELGTGSGIIACILAKEMPAARVVAVDASQAALEVAKANAMQLGCAERIHFCLSDWFTALEEDARFDVIISNPPYIEATDAHLAALKYEPRSALVAADKGLADLQHIVVQASRYLRPKGWLLLEHGYDQADAVMALMHQQGYQQVLCHTDLAGIPRVTQGQCL